MPKKKSPNKNLKIVVLTTKATTTGMSLIYEINERVWSKGHRLIVLSMDEPKKLPNQYNTKVFSLSGNEDLLRGADVVISFTPPAAFYLNDLETNARKMHLITESPQLYYNKELVEQLKPDFSESEVEREIESHLTYVDAVYSLDMDFIVTNKYLQKKVRRHGGKALLVNVGVNQATYHPEDYFGKREKPLVIVEGNHLTHKGLRGVVMALTPLVGSFHLWTISDTSGTIQAEKHWQNPNPDALRGILTAGDMLIRNYVDDGLAELQLQAMACGCPVITSDTPGATEFCKDGMNSLIAKSPEAIKMCVEQLINDAELRNNLIRGGFETASEMTWEKTVDQFLEAIGGKNG